MSYHAPVMQIIDVFDIVRTHAGFPVFLRVNIVNHTKIDVIGLHSLKNIFKCRNHKLHVPRPNILAILIGGADMPLHDPLFPAFGHCFSDNIPGFGIRHPAVYDVDPLLACIPHQIYRFRFLVTLQPFTAETDLTDHQSCFSQFSVQHRPLLINLCCALPFP